LVSPFSAPFCSPAPVLGDPPSSPARRSSDLFRVQESLEQEVVLQRVDISDAKNVCNQRAGAGAAPWADGNALLLRPADEVGDDQDRKSTRLNSSHVKISYAVFCLKKKKNGED